MASYIEKNKGWITSHKLKEFMRCQWCYHKKYVLELPDPTETEEVKEAFLVGQAADDLLTNPEGFDAKYEVMKRRTGKTGKVELTELHGKLLCQIQDEFRANDLVEHAPKKFIVETEYSGVKLRAELDHYDKENKLIRDIKTTANLATFNPAYYVHQMSFYQWLIEEVYGEKCDCVLDVVDKYKHFSRSIVIKYNNDTLRAYRGQILSALEDLKVAEASGIYLETQDQVELLNCPYWGLKTADCPHGHGRQKDFMIY